MTFSIISKYRSELMGYAIVGVLIGHILVFGGVHASGGLGVLSWLSYLIHTSGFLFLSGFGVYYSLRKDGDYGQFYTRRFYRFLLPFLIVAIPYFLVVSFANHASVLDYLGYISTAAFWYKGNYHGMWYIAVSLLLYVLTPPLYRWYTSNYKILWVKILVTLLVLFIANALIKSFFPDYWDMVEIGLSQMPCYFVGILFAHLSCAKQDKKSFVITLMALGALYIINQIWTIIPREYLTPLVSIPFFVLLFSVLFSFTASLSWLRWINAMYKWFGKYTFELYLLHIFLWFIVKEVLHLNAFGNIALAVGLAVILAIPVHWTTTTICDWLQNRLIRQNKK